MECIETGWISSEGPFVKRFEEEFAKRIGRKHAVAVTNGTAALDIAVEVLNIGKGDEVIVPTFTIISCLHQIIRSGATPVLVDCDPLTWNMDVKQVADKITPRTKAIMAVHIYGLPVDMLPLQTLAQEHGLKIIEDAAEALGQAYCKKSCGSFGDISTFSFYPNKHITTGEGGMVVTDDDHTAEQARSLRNLCFQPAKRFVHDSLGWNYRMTNMQAALGIAQLERLDGFIKRKREIGLLYSNLLSDVKGLQLPPVQTAYAENIFWVFGVVLDKSLAIDAAHAMKQLSTKGIGTRPFFYPMHMQPVFRKMNLFNNESYSVAETLCKYGFYLPSGLALTDDQAREVVQAVYEVVR
ncbi:DegT/DnrJ/EryC1/StrS family aminotransferase [Methylomonas sp. CM2]|uniref:DegT/DnrJ/EryC1/StrS family aminotransferase n=1 Tax=Methylomonas sp. CM2 TaxID=3417647 RepID=UPI003CED025F